jgi:hypothetical protein
VGKRIVPWMDIRRLDRPGNWLSPLIVRITLFDDSRMILIYPGDLDSCNSLLRHLRRLSRDALIDGVPYRQFWGEVLAPGGGPQANPAAALPDAAAGGRGRSRAALSTAEDGRPSGSEEFRGREVVRGAPPFRFPKIIVCIVIGLALRWRPRMRWWLAALGRLLVRDDGPARADIAVVLAGDFSGNRILRAAELVKQGYVPKVLVSGPHMLYGFYECDLEIPFAVKRGYPEAGSSARPMKPSARARRPPHFGGSAAPRRASISIGDQRLPHRARRAHLPGRRSRSRYAGGGRARQVFPADGWWRNREGQKVFFMEW